VGADMTAAVAGAAVASAGPPALLLQPTSQVAAVGATVGATTPNGTVDTAASALVAASVAAPVVTVATSASMLSEASCLKGNTAAAGDGTVSEHLQGDAADNGLTADVLVADENAAGERRDPWADVYGDAEIGFSLGDVSSIQKLIRQELEAYDDDDDD